MSYSVVADAAMTLFWVIVLVWMACIVERHREDTGERRYIIVLVVCLAALAYHLFALYAITSTAKASVTHADVERIQP